MNKIKLFCFPYAGGSAVVFSKWKQYLDPAIELRPVELAGRGIRIQEPMYNDVPDVIEDVYNLLKEEIKDNLYSLYGHSMGAMICYELAQKIRKNNLLSPIHIFFSGRGAPHVQRLEDKKYHLMPEEEFKKKIIGLGGTPPEFFNHPELIEMFLPLLRNDLKLAEKDLNHEKIHPLDCNITVLLGKEDFLSAEQCDGWKKHTTGLCTIHHLRGDHFFLHKETAQILRFINNTLLGEIYI
jgi:medium-chain acyl-[acyl-carrier-protein] hydrolase